MESEPKSDRLRALRGLFDSPEERTRKEVTQYEEPYLLELVKHIGIASIDFIVAVGFASRISRELSQVEALYWTNAQFFT